MSGAGKSTPVRGADHVARVTPANRAPLVPTVGVDRVAARHLFDILAEAFAPTPDRVARWLNSDAALGVGRY